MGRPCPLPPRRARTGARHADGRPAARRPVSCPEFTRGCASCISSRRARPCGSGSRPPSPQRPRPISMARAARRTCPTGPTLLVANEFFDALPVRQFVATERGWCERLVGHRRTIASIFGLRPERGTGARHRGAARRGPGMAGARRSRSTGEIARRLVRDRRRGPRSSTTAMGPGLWRHPAGGEAPRLRRSARRAGRGGPHRPCGFPQLAQAASAGGPPATASATQARFPRSARHRRPAPRP